MTSVRRRLRRTLIVASSVLVATPSAALAQTPASLGCAPSLIDGGSGRSAVCTVSLSAPAPAGGTVVTLTSSLTELAASAPTVVVPAGQTAASFAVGTNPRYRQYSGRAFTVDIGATANGATRTASLTVTAPPPPADFSSGSQAGSNTQWEGLMCGGIAPIGGYQDILYSCAPASGTGFGTCTFWQECTAGCRRVPPSGGRFSDFCATGGPNPISLSRTVVVGGDRVSAAIVAETPAGSAPAQEQGVPRVIDPQFNAASFPQNGIAFPNGATSVAFDVATSYVPAIQFVDVAGFWFNDAVAPLLITSGRGGHAWLVVLPPDPAPSVALPTLGDFRITGSNPVTGGQTTIGQIDLSGLSRAGGPTIALSSSHPDIVPPSTIVAPASQQVLGFQAFIATQPPAVATEVVVTASDGRYSFAAPLTVLPPPPPVLSSVSVNPSSVVGGAGSTGTVTLGAAQSGPTVVTLSTPAPPSVATLPSSVTVPAGATAATFPITTFPVSETFNLNVFADLAGSPGRQALLLITPGPSPPPPPGEPGFHSPSASAADSGGDGNGFEAGAAAAHADDSASAADMNSGTGTGTSCTSSGKDRHRFYDYGLQVPAGSAVVGIEVRLDARADSTSGSPRMCVQLSWDGGASWTAAKATPTLATAFSTYVLGAPADTWGRSWTAANLSNASFRVRVTNVASSTARDFFLEWIAVRLHVGAPPAAALSAVSVSPAAVTGGSPSTGTVTLTAAAPTGGAVVSLASSHPSAATVPGNVTVPAGAASATFSVTTLAVSTSTAVTVTASYGGATRTAALTVNPPASGDTVAIQRVEYDTGKAELRVEATSTSASATLQAFVTSSGQLIGTLTNDGGGRYSRTLSWPSNPQSVTVRSSLGGSAARSVTVK